MAVEVVWSLAPIPIGIGIWDLRRWGKGPHPPNFKLRLSPALPQHPHRFAIPALPKPLLPFPTA